MIEFALVRSYTRTFLGGSLTDRETIITARFNRCVNANFHFQIFNRKFWISRRAMSNWFYMHGCAYVFDYDDPLCGKQWPIGALVQAAKSASTLTVCDRFPHARSSNKRASRFIAVWTHVVTVDIRCTFCRRWLLLY